MLGIGSTRTHRREVQALALCVGAESCDCDVPDVLQMEVVDSHLQSDSLARRFRARRALTRVPVYARETQRAWGQGVASVHQVC